MFLMIVMLGWYKLNVKEINPVAPYSTIQYKDFSFMHIPEKALIPNWHSFVESILITLLIVHFVYSNYLPQFCGITLKTKKELF